MKDGRVPGNLSKGWPLPRLDTEFNGLLMQLQGGFH